MKTTIRRAETNEEILAAFAVMKQLRPKLRKPAFVASVRKLEATAGYQLAALRLGGEVVGVAGFRLCHNLAWGKFLYVDDLVTDSNHRSAQVGKKLFDWLLQCAKEEQCDELHLDSGVFRHEAHRFYLRERMDITCFHFGLTLHKN